MQHGRTPKNRWLPFAKCLNAWPWCLLFIWLKRWLPSFGLFWHIPPKSSMMTGRRICYAPTTGCSPSFRNCCIHRPVTMPQGQEKGIDPAVAWPGSLHTLGHPRNWNHLLLAPDLLTGLVVFAMRIPCRSGFLPTGPQWYFASCKTRRMLTERLTHLGWTWMWLRMILRSSGRRPMTTGGWKIKVGTSSPNVPSSIHERTHHRSSSKEALHVKWAHDKAECPSPGDSNRSTCIRFFKLNHLFFFR